MVFGTVHQFIRIKEDTKKYQRVEYTFSMLLKVYLAVFCIFVSGIIVSLYNTQYDDIPNFLESYLCAVFDTDTCVPVIQ